MFGILETSPLLLGLIVTAASGLFGLHVTSVMKLFKTVTQHESRIAQLEEDVDRRLGTISLKLDRIVEQNAQILVLGTRVTAVEAEISVLREWRHAMAQPSQMMELMNRLLENLSAARAKA